MLLMETQTMHVYNSFSVTLVNTMNLGSISNVFRHAHTQIAQL